jgi:hypothetical protein
MAPMMIPAVTKMTITTCIQNQNGFTAAAG